jgi:ATP-dependent helicase HrpB
VLAEEELRAVHGAAIRWREACRWSRREGRVLARRQECFGALVLDDRPWPEAPAAALAAAALEGLRQIGLPFTPAARRLRARIQLARGGDDHWPDVSDAALLARGPDWLMPALARARSEADLRGLDLTEPLRGLLTWDQAQALDRIAPPIFRTPLGRAVPIDYEGEAPAIAVKLQEMFGVTRHPVVGAAGLPVKVTLLSPGGHPLQVTTDLPGFWARSYADVRRDMRGQYPRHPWPEDPAQAAPTTRAKPRGT